MRLLMLVVVVQLGTGAKQPLTQVEQHHNTNCTNGPQYNNIKCGDTGSGCHYTTSAESSNTCSWECDAGYYTSNNGTKCERCPFGATSEADAKSAGECFFDNTTPIQDSKGTYPVPSGVKIYLSTGTLLD